MYWSGEMRASDADRQAAIDRLRVHTVEGRLTLDEFECRVGEVLTAKTHADLAAALRELPEPRPVRSASPSGRPSHRSSGLRLPVPMLVVIVVVVGSVLMRHFAFWLIPVGFCVFGGWSRGGNSRARASA